MRFGNLKRKIRKAVSLFSCFALCYKGSDVNSIAFKKIFKNFFAGGADENAPLFIQFDQAFENKVYDNWKEKLKEVYNGLRLKKYKWVKYDCNAGGGSVWYNKTNRKYEVKKYGGDGTLGGSDVASLAEAGIMYSIPLGLNKDFGKKKPSLFSNILGAIDGNDFGFGNGGFNLKGGFKGFGNFLGKFAKLNENMKWRDLFDKGMMLDDKDTVNVNNLTGILEIAKVKLEELPTVEEISTYNADNDFFYYFPMMSFLSSDFDGNDQLKQKFFSGFRDHSGFLLFSIRDGGDGIIGRYGFKALNEYKKKLYVDCVNEIYAKNEGYFSPYDIIDNCSHLDFFGRIFLKYKSDDALVRIWNTFQNGEFFDLAGKYAVQVYDEGSGIFGKYRRSKRLMKSMVKSAAWAGAPYLLGCKLPSIFLETVLPQLSAYGGRLIGSKCQNFLAKRNILVNNPSALKEAIREMFKENVVGLDGVIDDLTRLAMGDICLAKSKKLFNKGRCRLMTFLGPPGCGKSMMANRLAIALTGNPLPSWGYVTSASLRPGVSPVDQFFDANSDLVVNLKRCKGKTVLFFDEIDKYDSRELLEKFRDALDSGTIEVTSRKKVTEAGFGASQTFEKVCVEKLDVSGLIVIFATNEKPECWGLPPDDPSNVASSVGRTQIKRDGSMVQRFKRFKFDPFKIGEYKLMFDNAFKSLKSESVDVFGFDVVFEADLSEKLARESYSSLLGARVVAELLSSMAGSIVDYGATKGIKKCESLLGKFKGMLSREGSKLDKALVSFDVNSHSFVVEEYVDKSSHSEKDKVADVNVEDSKRGSPSPQQSKDSKIGAMGLKNEKGDKKSHSDKNEVADVNVKDSEGGSTTSQKSKKPKIEKMKLRNEKSGHPVQNSKSKLGKESGRNRGRRR